METVSLFENKSAAPTSSTVLETPRKTAKVSIIIPVYNESPFVSAVIQRVLDAPMPSGVAREVIVIDDGSTDGTTEILQKMDKSLIKVHHSVLNFGKGVAIRIGLKHATGDVVVIQDADMEYDPAQLIHLVQPILEGKERVVYGSRFKGQMEGMRFKYFLANRLLVWSVRFLYGAWITDEATAYKAFEGNLVRALPLKCRRFEFCPEVTAEILKKGIRIHEVPISYVARTTEEGKKISFKDGIEAFWTLFKHRF